MNITRTIEQVRRLSDGELLAGLTGALGASCRWVALVLAHLAEVDERRLHLLAGHTSLFVYCTSRLAMSEDEAYRRIRVARLTRRFPIVLDQVASGQISLSVAALVEPHLTVANHLELLSAVSKKTVRQTREVLAAWFPQPDVLPFIRKLPERRDAATSSSRQPTVGTANERPHGADTHVGTSSPMASSSTLAPHREPAWASPIAGQRITPTALPVDTPAGNGPRPVVNPRSAAEPTAAVGSTAPVLTAATPAPVRRTSSAVEPLSPGRYKFQLTVDAELKRKLELASDLLRHAVPDGDLATIVGRALDLLIEKILRRRFGKTSKGGKTTPASTACPQEPVTGCSLEIAASKATVSVAVAEDTHSIYPAASTQPIATTNDDAGPTRPHPSPPRSASSHSPATSASRYLPSAVRRAVLERDGARCTWQGPDGTRCDSQAWLEHDHIIPRGQGGTDGATNIRIRCRAHNRLTAERAYGQQTITQIIARRRAARQHPPDLP